MITESLTQSFHAHREELINLVAFAVFLESWDDSYVGEGSGRLEYLFHKWNTEWLPMRNSDHYGDCVKVPMACLRCQIDEMFSKAEKVVSTTYKNKP